MKEEYTESYEPQQMQQKMQDIQQNQLVTEKHFQMQKKQALKTLLQAEQLIQQTASAADSQSLMSAQQQIQQAAQQVNQMQGLAVTQSTPAVQQQLEQVQQQIKQASQTLSLIQSLNNANNSFKKG